MPNRQNDPNAALRAMRKDQLIQGVMELQDQAAELHQQLQQMTRDLNAAQLFGSQQTEKLGVAEDRLAERQAMVETLKRDNDASIRNIRALSALVNEQNDQKVSLESQLEVCKERVEALLDALVASRQAGQ